MVAEWILLMIYGLLQPGSMTRGVRGPMDPCPGEGKNGRKMGLRTKQRQQSEEKQTNLLSKIRMQDAL